MRTLQICRSVAALSAVTRVVAASGEAHKF
jgi:hypothetical protein